MRAVDIQRDGTLANADVSPKGRGAACCAERIGATHAPPLPATFRGDSFPVFLEVGVTFHGLLSLMLAGACAQAGAQDGRSFSAGHCRAEFRKCDRVDGACVWLGIPVDLDCDRNCQIRLMAQ